MAFEIRKVLCATDGSNGSRKAIDFAVETVKRFPSVEIDFLHVVRGQATPEEARYLGAVMVEASEAQEYIELQYAAKAAQEAGVSGFQCVKMPAARNVAAAIIDYAEKQNVDHIIMGSTGKTGVGRLLLGSVAGEVVHKAHCPVTVVR
jgi:nucleotide-binding universal stress UspA family protein